MITILKVKIYDNKNKTLWKKKTHRGTISSLTTTKWFRECKRSNGNLQFFEGFPSPFKTLLASLMSISGS